MNPATQQPTSKTTAAAHGADGRFVRGNPGGRGNPNAAKVAAFRQVLLDTATAEDMAKMVRALIEAATDGNVQAIKLFLAYTLGKPGTQPDGDPQPWPIPTAEPTVAPPSARTTPTPPPARDLEAELADVFNHPERYLDKRDALLGPSPNGDFSVVGVTKAHYQPPTGKTPAKR